jgi:hypothetical protein
MFTPALGSEGTQQLTGAYVPDAGFNPSTGTAGVQVMERTTTTTIKCSTAKTAHTALQCTITVSDTSPGTPVTPTGIVRFNADDAKVIPHPCTLSNGSCSVTVTHWERNQVLKASYQGDTNHTDSHGTAKLT